MKKIFIAMAIIAMTQATTMMADNNKPCTGAPNVTATTPGHPGMMPQGHPGMAPQGHPSMAPQGHPGMMPQAHQAHPGMAPHAGTPHRPGMKKALPGCKCKMCKEIRRHDDKMRHIMRKGKHHIF